MIADNRWTYDEMKHVGTDYESKAEVEDYDRRMSKIRDISAEIEEALSALELSAGQSLIEFGTGTGELALAASERCGLVIAADISTAMLGRAKEKAAARGRGNIRFVQAGFLGYRHEGEPLDAAVTQIALHHLPDFWKQVALINIARILKPGGRLFVRDLVFSFKLEKYDSTIDRMLERFRDAAGDGMADKVANHIKNEFSTFDWVMEEMLYRAGFDIVSADYGDYFLAGYLCTKSRDG
jgi:putative AdoMet-dependent methyltransferase